MVLQLPVMLPSVRPSVPSAAFCSDMSKLARCRPKKLPRSCILIAFLSQGVISVILVMDEFLGRFSEVSDTAPGAGFKKGLMTAILTLGAFIGMTLDVKLTSFLGTNVKQER